MFDATTSDAEPPPLPPAPMRTTRVLSPVQLLAKAGTGSSLVTPAGVDTPALVAGKFTISGLREGLYLHCTDIDHLCDMTTHFKTQEAGIKVILKLEGNARVSFGGVPLPLDAGQGTDARPCGAVLTLARPEDFERRACGGTHERMVVLTLSPSWLRASGLPIPDIGEHLRLAPWAPSPRAIAIAEQLIRLDATPGQAHCLHLESRALELIGEALRQTRPEPAGAPVEAAGAGQLRPAEHQRITRLQKHLENGDFDHLGLDEIARCCGSNANTLQRQFRLVFGKSIFDYLRVCRLQRAAEALEIQGISVARAAEIAGYASQANFSTAFRRHFGVTPKQFRARI